MRYRLTETAKGYEIVEKATDKTILIIEKPLPIDKMQLVADLIRMSKCDPSDIEDGYTGQPIA